jgi:hypothetical protein
MTDESTNEAISEMAEMVHADQSVDDTLSRLLQMAQDAVAAADIAGLTMIDDHGRPATPYFSDELAPHVDAAQYASGRGPCLDAWRELQTVRLDRICDAEDRYPEFAASARGAGISSALSVPVTASSKGLGALNFYAHAEGVFSDVDVIAAQAVVIPIGATIANVSAYWHAHDLAIQLEQAMASRAAIEQAKGIIMASMGCDPDTAFQVLRSQSQAQNRKLRELAEELVARQAR